MSNYGKWGSLALIAFAWMGVARADHAPGHSGMVMSGSLEGGYAYSSTTGTKDSQFLVDHAMMSMSGDVSDKLKFHVTNAFSVQNGATSALGLLNNTASYFSGATLGAAGGFQFSNLGAYIEHECAKGVYTSVGHMANPWGMENMWSRYDMPTYYYSASHTVAHGYGWDYGVGFNWRFVDVLPGTFEASLIDGHTVAGEKFNLAGSARWMYELKSGDWSFTPVASTYLGRWKSGPSDLGISAGGMFKMSSFWANAEWVYASRKTPAGSAGVNAKDWTIYVEPGADLGMANLSVKWQLQNNGTNSDMHIGAAVSHVYSDKLRVRLTYEAMNINKKLAAAISHDFRLLLGTKW